MHYAFDNKFVDMGGNRFCGNIGILFLQKRHHTEMFFDVLSPVCWFLLCVMFVFIFYSTS